MASAVLDDIASLARVAMVIPLLTAWWLNGLVPVSIAAWKWRVGAAAAAGAQLD